MFSGGKVELVETSKGPRVAVGGGGGGEGEGESWGGGGGSFTGVRRVGVEVYMSANHFHSLTTTSLNNPPIFI